MSYTVFARKYRPKTFDEVIGQDHIVRTLKNAIAQQRLAHAYIFVGPRGTGKTSTARILAKALNCTGGPKIDFDPEEPACREIAEGRSMNVLEFDAASNTGVDKIRDIIIDNVKFAPVGGAYKVYIVDEVHMLSTSSFNALLKTLEEPPPHVIFVFATTDVQKVPTTILSRCQRFDLKRIPTALIRDHLLMIAKKEGLDLARAAAESIARGAEGGMRDAESMLDQLVAFCGEKIAEADVLRVFGFTSQQTVAQLCDHLISGEASAALRIVHSEAEAGRDLSRLLANLIGHLRALLVVKTDPSALAEELDAEAIAAAQQQAQRIDLTRLLDLIERCAEAEQRMKWAPNKKMHLEIAIIRAIQTLGQATLSEVLDTLTAMRDGTPSPPTPAPAIETPTRAVRPTPATQPTPAANPTEPAARKAPPAPESEPAPVLRETPPSPAPLDLPAVWAGVKERFCKERPLYAKNIAHTVLLEIQAGTALVGIDADDSLSRELLDTPSNRKVIEALLHELAGGSCALKFTPREGLAPKAAPASEGPRPEASKDPLADFKNDPLIRKALEIFKAEIQPA